MHSVDEVDPASVPFSVLCVVLAVILWAYRHEVTAHSDRFWGWSRSGAAQRRYANVTAAIGVAVLSSAALFGMFVL